MRLAVWVFGVAKHETMSGGMLRGRFATLDVRTGRPLLFAEEIEKSHHLFHQRQAEQGIERRAACLELPFRTLLSLT